MEALAYRWRYIPGLLLVMAAALIGDAHARPITVFVSILPQRNFVERIAGQQAEVMVMVGPGDSPATYEPKPRQVAALSQARVYFRIGVPFETAWMTRLRAANREMLIVDTAQGILRRRTDRLEPGSSEAGAFDDPHIWTNPALVRLMAAHIRDTFIEIDPGNAGTYVRNHDRFAADLDALDAEIRGRLAKYSGRSILAFHASWGYFADAYGLRQIPIEVAGKEPGPRTLARVIDEAKALGVKVVFVQPQFSRATAAMIAREVGARVEAVDPLAEDYIENLRRVTAAIADAMVLP